MFRLPLRFEAGTAVLLSSYDEQVLHGCWQSLTQEKSRCALQIGGKTLPLRGLADLRRHRIAVWDGTAEPPALQENLTLQENILLPSMQRISRCGFFERAAKRVFSDREFWRRPPAWRNGAGFGKNGAGIGGSVAVLSPTCAFYLQCVFLIGLYGAPDPAAVCAGPVRQRYHGGFAGNRRPLLSEFCKCRNFFVKSGAPCKGN